MVVENKPVVGLDVGGTKIYAGVIDWAGNILATERKKTKAESGFEASSYRMIDCIKCAIRSAGLTIDDIAAIGIGAPGPLDLDKGTIIETPNLNWKNAPIRDVIVRAFNKPAKLDNDVNAGLLGEYVYGLDKTVKHVIGLFIGTGLGGGIIIDGNLYHGFNQNAGELGHMIINPQGPRCGCGNKGCLEAYTSKVAIERMLRLAMEKGHKTSIAKKIKENNRLGSAVLAEAYFSGDKLVQKVIRKTARYLGIGLTSYFHIFNPEVVVLGGGIVEAFGADYLNMVQKEVEKYAFPITRRDTRIIAARFKDNSGILGASVLAREALANCPR